MAPRIPTSRNLLLISKRFRASSPDSREDRKAFICLKRPNFYLNGQINYTVKCEIRDEKALLTSPIKDQGQFHPKAYTITVLHHTQMILYSVLNIRVGKSKNEHVRYS